MGDTGEPLIQTMERMVAEISESAVRQFKEKATINEEEAELVEEEIEEEAAEGDDNKEAEAKTEPEGEPQSKKQLNENDIQKTVEDTFKFDEKKQDTSQFNNLKETGLLLLKKKMNFGSILKSFACFSGNKAKAVEA